MSSIDPSADYRAMAVALRVGSLLLAGGSSTDDVERSMRRVALAAGLAEVQSVVTLGILTMSAVRASDGQPITQLRLVSQRTSEYRRLTAAAELVDRLESGVVSADAAIAELDRIDALPAAYSPLVMTLAIALSSAAAVLLFGGGAADAVVTLAIGLAVDPVVQRLDRSPLPEFFRALIGPLLATLLAIVLVAVGLPIDGGLIVTAAILRFLPGSALVAGMRDLIDRSIISGTARLAEAMLLGSAVAVGTAAGIRIGAALGGPALTVGVLTASTEGLLLQGVAAAVACATFGLALGVDRRRLLSVGLLGGGAWLVNLLGMQLGWDLLLPVVVAAVMVGAAGQALALQVRMPSVVWTVPAILPLLPGLTIVRGILELGTIAGVLTVVAAIGIGFALGAGVAFGSILVAVARQAGEAAQAVMLPVLGEIDPVRAVGAISRTTRRRRPRRGRATGGEGSAPGEGTADEGP